MSISNGVSLYIKDSEDGALPELKRFKPDRGKPIKKNADTKDLQIDGEPLNCEDYCKLTPFSFIVNNLEPTGYKQISDLDLVTESTAELCGFTGKSLECRLRDLDLQKPSSDFDPWRFITAKDEDGDNLLFIAIIVRETQLSKSFIDIAPSYDKLDVVNKLYQTALHLAAVTGNSVIVRRLIVAGAKVDERDYQLNTPLHIAVGKGFMKVAKALITPVTYLESKQNQYEIPYQKIPQNLEIYNAAGLTCLHIAGHNSDKRMVDLLLSNEANINARELKSGRTLLHYFAEIDNMEMVKYLVSKPRLILDKQTYCGITAAELAYSRCHFGIAYLLCSYGANYTMSQQPNSSGSESDSEN